MIEHADQSDLLVAAVVKNAMYLPAILVGLSLHNYWILAVMLLLDVITGAWRSAVVNGPDSLTSWRALNGLFSKFLFLLIPLVVAYMGRGMGLELVAVAQSALGLLIFATGYSIIGNIYGIRSGRVVREFDAVRVILTWLERFLDKLAPDNHKDNNRHD